MVSSWKVLRKETSINKNSFIMFGFIYRKYKRELNIIKTCQNFIYFKLFKECFKINLMT